MSATHRTTSRLDRIRNGEPPRRQPRREPRRQGTRRAVVLAATREQVSR